MTARLVFNPRHASSNLSFFLRPFFLFFSFSIFLLPVFSKRLLLLILRARSISWEIREIVNHCIRSQSFSEIIPLSSRVILIPLWKITLTTLWFCRYLEFLVSFENKENGTPDSWKVTGRFRTICLFRNTVRFDV